MEIMSKQGNLGDSSKKRAHGETGNRHAVVQGGRAGERPARRTERRPQRRESHSRMLRNEFFRT